MFLISNNSILINNINDFVASHILECGQIFRYKKISTEHYIVFSKDKKCEIIQEKDSTKIICDDVDYFINFFDLNRDYSNIKSQLSNLPFMTDSLVHGNGIRILNQDPWEMLISFIISANNNIPRIQSIIAKLCTTLGKDMCGYYSFPTAEAMASMSEDFYRNIGAGYRARYLLQTAQRIANGYDLNQLFDMPTKLANEQLLSFVGVGQKVADCILLFAYHKQDVFPVDTWIKKVYCQYLGELVNPNQIRAKLLDIYGNLSGYAQQYLFFYKRQLG